MSSSHEKVLVKCKNCNREYYKDKSSLDQWKGSCLSCFKKSRKSRNVHAMFFVKGARRR